MTVTHKATPLTVVFQPAEGGWRLSYRDRHGVELHARVATRAALDRLAFLGHLRSHPEVLVRDFGGLAGVDRGHALCEWLFGSDAVDQPTILRGLGVPGERPNVRSAAIALELRTDNHLLLAQPWHVLSWKGARLFADGWTVRLAPPHLPAPGVNVEPVALPPEPRVLVFSPVHDALHDDIDAVGHAEDLFGLLKGLGCPENALRVVSSEHALRHALRSAEWDILYCFGHGRAGEDGPELVIPGGDALRIATLGEMLAGRSPRVVYLNACSTGSGGWHGAGNVLVDERNAVLAYVCPVRADWARGRALVFFRRLLLGGDDPVSAFMPRPQELDSDSGHFWMCGAVHSNTRRWSMPPPRTPASVRARVNRLNRRPQRGAVHMALSEELLEPGTPVRGLAFVATAGPGNRVRALGDQLHTSLRVEGRLGRRLVRIEPRVPSLAAQRSFGTPWDDELRACLRASPGDDVRAAVRAHVRARGVREEDAIVFFDFGGWPRGNSREIPRTMTWIEQCRDWTLSLAPGTPLRLLFFLGIETDDESHRGGIHRGLNDADFYDRNNQGEFAYQLLEELQPVTREDLHRFLRRDRTLNLSSRNLRRIASAILEKAIEEDGSVARYDLCAALLERVMTERDWTFLESGRTRRRATEHQY